MLENVTTYMTVQELAGKLNYHPSHIRYLIRTGQLEAIKLKGWRISPEAVEKFIESRSVRHDKGKSGVNEHAKPPMTD